MIHLNLFSQSRKTRPSFKHLAHSEKLAIKILMFLSTAGQEKTHLTIATVAFEARWEP